VLLGEFAGVAIGHARRFSGTRERRDELERTVMALEATTQIARAVGAETDLETILELVAKRGRALVAARTLLIELAEGDELVVAAAAGEFHESVLGERIPLADSAASAALHARQTRRLDDEVTRTRFEQSGLGRLGVAVSSGLVVPLVFRDRAYGALVAVDRLVDGPRFSRDDERLLEAFATSAATAVATAHSVAAEHQRQRLAAAEHERRRWARELHDQTLQGLAALQIGLGAAQRSGAPEELARAIGDALDTLAHEITNLRELITDLRPAALDDFGVAVALETLIERVRRGGLEVDLSTDLAWEAGRAASRHTPELEAALYRLVQEALTNAVKHGQARRAVVEISEDDRLVHLTVRDDGAGFDPSAQAGGFGLLGMRERVQLLRGTLRVESEIGAGTTVEATLPALRRADVSARPAAEVREITGS
jgi:signal transduction histidine kinase